MFRNLSKISLRNINKKYQLVIGVIVVLIIVYIWNVQNSARISFNNEVRHFPNLSLDKVKGNRSGVNEFSRMYGIPVIVF